MREKEDSPVTKLSFKCLEKNLIRGTLKNILSNMHEAQPTRVSQSFRDQGIKAAKSRHGIVIDTADCRSSRIILVLKRLKMGSDKECARMGIPSRKSGRSEGWSLNLVPGMLSEV